LTLPLSLAAVERILRPLGFVVQAQLAEDQQALLQAADCFWGAHCFVGVAEFEQAYRLPMAGGVVPE
jgi:hypothetical protein